MFSSGTLSASIAGASHKPKATATMWPSDDTVNPRVRFSRGYSHAGTTRRPFNIPVPCRNP